MLVLQSNEKVTLVVSRKRSNLPVSHSRTKSAPVSHETDSSNTLLSHKSVSCDSLTPPIPPHHAATNNLNRRFTSQELQHKCITIVKVSPCSSSLVTILYLSHKPASGDSLTPSVTPHFAAHEQVLPS